MNALEKELKELKAQGGGTTAAPAAPGTPGALKLTPPPPPLPGLEGLPGRGSNKQETLLVEKEMTHEVIGQVNGDFVVREGSTTFVMTPKEFKAYETLRRKRIVRKLTIDSVGENAKLAFPESRAPGEAADAAPAVVNQARAPDVNAGRPIAPPPAPVVKPAESKAPGKK